MSIFDYEGKVEEELNAEQKAFKSGANDSVLARSLRGGVLGAKSQLLSTGAGIADAVGADEIGAGLHQRSRSLRDEAALPGNSPRVGSYAQLRDNFSMDNLGEFVGGLIGGSAPATALGIAGGLATGGAGLVPGLLGAGAATLPLNMGEVIQKQQADPQALQQGAGTRLGDAFLGGAGASAVESLVPGLVGRQVLGKGLANLGKETVKQTLGRNALDIPLEGLTEGTGTAIKQYAANQDKELDWNEIKEGAIGGAAAGSVFTGVGTAADLARGVAPKTGEMLSSARTSIKDRISGLSDSAVQSPVGKKVSSLSDDLMGMVGAGKTKAEDLVGKVMRGEELGVDPAEWAKATTDEARARLTQLSDTAAIKAATKWGKEMLDDVGLDAGRRQELTEAMANITDKGSRMAVAGMRQSWELGKKAGERINRFADAMRVKRTSDRRADVDVEASWVDDRDAYPDGSWEPMKALENAAATPEPPKKSINARRAFIDKMVSEGMTPDDARTAYVESLNKPRTKTPDAPKYSMDDSGARKLVMDALTESGLSQKRPELFSSASSINMMAGGLLEMVTGMTKGRLSSEQIGSAIEVFGDATASVMASVRAALTDDATPAETEAFFTNLSEIDAIRKRSNGLHDTMRMAFTEEAQRSESLGRVEEDAKLLVAHARGQFDAKSGAKPTAQQEYMNTLVNDYYTQNFGAKADVVRAAVEAEATPAKAEKVGAATTLEYDEDGEPIKADDSAGESGRDPLKAKFDEQGNRLEVAPAKVMRYGLSKPNVAGKSRSALNGAAMLENSLYAKQHLLDLKAEFPDHDVRFERLPGSDYGHIVVEDRSAAEVFDAEDFKAMAHDTKNYPDSPSRIKVGDRNIDAVKLAKVMRTKMQDDFEGDRPTTSTERLIDAFKQGVAQLTDQSGEVFEVPDNAVIGFVGGKPLTWRQAKKHDARGHDDRLRDTNAREQEDLRELYKRAKEEGADTKTLGAIRGKYLDLLKEHDEVLNGELGQGEDVVGRTPQRLKAEVPGADGRPASAIRTRSNAVGVTRADNGASEDALTMKPDKDGNIHEGAARMKAQDLIHRSNMDGSKHYVHSNAVEGLNTLSSVIQGSWRKVKTAGAQSVANRAQTLIANAAMMSAADQRRLMSLAPDPVEGVKNVPPASVADAAPLINELARKYKDRIVAAGEKGGTPDPKPVAAKKAAFLERAASGDETLLAELASSTDAKGLQRAAEALPVGHALDVVSARLSELVSGSEDLAYGLQTKRYSLEGTTYSGKLADRPIFSDLAVGSEADQAIVEKLDARLGRSADGRRAAVVSERGNAETARAERVAGAIGKKVVWVRNLGTDGVSDPAIPGVIFLDPGSARSVQVLAAHELAHSLERDDPAKFRKLTDEIGQHVDPDEWDGFVQRQDKMSDDEGTKHLTEDQKISEMVANLLSDYAYRSHEGMTKVEFEARGGDFAGYGGYLKDGAQPIVDAALEKFLVAHGHSKDSLRSNESTDPTKNNASHKQLSKDIRSHIEKVLGKSVKLAWAKFTHAGEFERMKTGDIIRLSVHALNPMSTAYHESLHAFIAQLRDAGAHDVVDVLYKAANAPQVMKRLREVYKDQPAVLQQLKDPEERVAYMYQLWAANPNALTLGPAAKTVFERLAAFFRSVLGIWSNDERALHIMRYFNDGSYAKSMGTPNATHRAMMDVGRNKVIEKAKTFTVPLGYLADAVLSTGDARLRDTNLAALNDLADRIKRSGTDEGGDQGYIPAARVETTKRLGKMADALAEHTPETLSAAIDALQSGAAVSASEVAAAVTDVKAILRSTKDYMERAGVKLGDLGSDYFPRVWDTHYISQNEQALRDMLEPYVRSGEFKGNVTDFIRSLTSRGGNEFGIETSTPGMQFTKKRDLSFLKAADVAPFLEKDLTATLASYISQAARKAEWERRLGGWDESLKETKLMTLMREAKEQGATPEQLEVATQYLKGVDGTLGDNINPHARRIMGNMIVYQNVRLLPMAMFSMLIDPMGVMVRGGTVGEAFSAFKRGMASIPVTYGRKAKDDEAAQLAELVGVVDSAVMSHVMSDVYTQGMVGGTAKKINNTFFKYNMVEGLNRAFRVGASEAAMAFMARHADGKGPHSVRWMAELGLQSGDIQMLASATGGGRKNRIALTQAEGLTAAQERRVHAAVNQWVDGAILRPDAADKPIWMNDPHFALISHMKQFVFSFQKTILDRMVHELRNGNYAPAMALAGYVPMMIAADTAKGLIQGGGDTPEWKRDWGVAEYVGYGVQRAGLLGVSQFGVDVANDVQRGGSGAGALVGPTLEQLADAVQLLGGHKQFGATLLDAMPANALYKEAMGAE